MFTTQLTNCPNLPTVTSSGHLVYLGSVECNKGERQVCLGPLMHGQEE